MRIIYLFSNLLTSYQVICDLKWFTSTRICFSKIIYLIICSHLNKFILKAFNRFLASVIAFPSRNILIPDATNIRYKIDFTSMSSQDVSLELKFSFNSSTIASQHLINFVVFMVCVKTGNCLNGNTLRFLWNNRTKEYYNWLNISTLYRFVLIFQN